MTLQESLDRLKTKIEGSMPPPFVQIMHQATADLEATGIGEGILKAESPAPEFQLPNQNGALVSSKELLKNGPLVVTFYRGMWCPYCNTDLSNLKRYKGQLEELGASMLSISPQLPEFNKQITERHRLNFDLLTDSGNEVAAKFGLRWEMVDPLKALYRDNFGIKLPDFNGENSWTLPVPARFIIGTDGIIKYAEYAVDYTKRPNPDVVVEALQSL
ncbi:MAG: AhpC/TSA family protein [Mameliella sp.]|nr:AhpC/TSA family protein [Phaeodactylibacter sp.]NRA52025.1 AhpC/TSA family protein [Phaeodactylibacter sp.]